MTPTIIERLRDIPEGFDRPLYYDAMEDGANCIEGLLHALETLAEVASGFSVSGVYFDEPGMTAERAALKAAYSAIAKARGEA